jgi:hypothetical protein
VGPVVWATRRWDGEVQHHNFESATMAEYQT